jgi:molybdopterin molybdotransferase
MTHALPTVTPIERPALGAEELVALIRQTCEPVDTERVPLSLALGRVLREPVNAPEDQPAFDRSAVDGYAVRSDDTSDVFHVLDEIRAGDWKPRSLQAGEAVRIATGGALPATELKVIMKEAAEVTGDTLRVLRKEPERHVRLRGEDAVCGQLLVPAPISLTAGALALLASFGCTKIVVSRLPRVVHIATGSEIVAPEETPGPGQIRDSNSTLVRAFLQQHGVTPQQLRVPEEETATEAALRTSSENADLILISGGASVGKHDFTRGLLERAGFEILVSKMATRPGKPLIFARRGRAIAFGLPGNPLAHFVCLNLFVRIALEKLAGLPLRPLWRQGVLAEEFETGGNPRETFWPAFCHESLGTSSLTPLRWSSSGDLTALATANALIRVASGASSLARGATVAFLST